MNIVTLDFETFFDDDYSLKKMTTEAYVRDPRFEVLGCGFRWSDGLQEWTSGVDDTIEALAWMEGEADAILCHHAQFDGLVLSHHFGIKPAFWLDTLSMGRMVLGNHLSVALESLAKHFHLPAKNVPYQLFKGKRWDELDAGTQQQVADGCLHDVDLTWRIFQELMRNFPAEELRTIDTTIRMFTEPVLEGDVPLLGGVWMAEERRKAALLAELAVGPSELQSSDKFAALLQAEGVEPEQKEGKNGSIYAFAKTDEFMKGLIEDENPRVAMLAAARLGIKSTIDQTRAERLGWMARRGPMPVYLKYAGAHTLRWGGGDAVNWQNFRRGSDIRRAIKAPEGYKLVILDLAQIECIVLSTLAGQWDVVEDYRAGKDLYIPIAEAFYGYPIDKNTNKIERQFGKVLRLGCGFGMGAAKLQATCRVGPFGGPPIILPDEQAVRGIETYRSTSPHVVAYWGTAGRMIARVGGGPPLEWGPMLIRDNRIFLPNGAWLTYDTLEYHRRESEDDPWEDGWRYRTRTGWTKLYGGKLVENVVQALARVVLSQAMNRIVAKGYKIANCTHDEVLVVVKADKAEYAYEECKAEMERSPVWLPELPVKAEGGISERYEK